MSAEFEVVFFLIFDQSMILIPACRISLLIVTKLEFLWHIWQQLHWLALEKLIFIETFVSYFCWNYKIKYPQNVFFFFNREIKYPRNLMPLKFYHLFGYLKANFMLQFFGIWVTFRVHFPWATLCHW